MSKFESNLDLKRKKEKDYFKNIKYFFENSFDANATESFFRHLHNQNPAMYNKTFMISVKDTGKMWGKFFFEYRYYYESQFLELNSFENYDNVLYKKALQMINYLHETTHEKQRDFYIYNNQGQVPETSEYNKLLNLEIFCSDNAKLPKYEQLLVEIDAIHNSIVKYKQLFEHECFEKTPETLCVMLYACVRYMASINGQKHHVYFPEKYELSSKTLIEYYKDFYKNLVIADTYRNKKLYDLICTEEYLYEIKKDELKNINFDNIKQDIDKKTSEVFSIMQECYNDLLKLYKPSKYVKNHFNLAQNDWNEFVKNNNMVKIAAIISDDLHAKYAKKQPMFIKYVHNNENCL